MLFNQYHMGFLSVFGGEGGTILKFQEPGGFLAPYTRRACMACASAVSTFGRRKKYTLLVHG